MEISIIYYTYEINITTNLLEDYVNFVDNTKKQNKYFKLLILFVVILCLFLFFVLFNCISKKYSYDFRNTSLRIHVIIH